MHTIQIHHIIFARDEKRGEDGAAWYLILSPCPGDPPGEPCRHVCEKHPGMHHAYERQAFRLGAFGHRLDATPDEIRDDKANVWGWDGNRGWPTLMPSFLAKKDRPYVLHSYLQEGKLVLCADSTVALDPSPNSCWDS